MSRIDDLKEYFDLKPHPEGGYYKRVFTSDRIVREDSLENSYSDNRPIMTAILYLLPGNSYSRFHKIKSDEIWHFYEGGVVNLHVLSEEQGYRKRKLGMKLESNQSPQITISGNTWFAASCEGNYTLVGCTVAPGFSFDDWELGERDQLQRMFPEHSDLISKYT